MIKPNGFLQAQSFLSAVLFQQKKKNVFVNDETLLASSKHKQAMTML